MAMIPRCSRSANTPVGSTAKAKAPAAASFQSFTASSMQDARARPLSTRLAAMASGVKMLTMISGATPRPRPLITAGR